MERLVSLRKFCVCSFAFVLLVTGCAGWGTQGGAFDWMDVLVDKLWIGLGERIKIEIILNSINGFRSSVYCGTIKKGSAP